jgi:hypothetical protein
VIGAPQKLVVTAHNMKKNKLKIYLVLVGAVLAVLAMRKATKYPFRQQLASLITKKNYKQEVSTPLPSITIDEEPFPTVPEITPLFDKNDIPKGPTFELSGVSIKNFYNNAENVGEILGDVVLVNKPNYKIIYYPLDKAFLIPILASPFDKVKENAEKDFLESLDINQEDACKLKVDITTAAAVNPQQAGENHQLSFCE